MGFPYQFPRFLDAQNPQLWAPEASYEAKTVSKSSKKKKQISPKTIFFRGIVFSHPWGALGPQFVFLQIFIIFFHNIFSLGSPGVPGGEKTMKKRSRSAWHTLGSPGVPLGIPGFPLGIPGFPLGTPRFPPGMPGVINEPEYGKASKIGTM